MISLTKHELEKIKVFRYKTNESTFIEKYFYNHVWDAMANNLPDSLAPNLMTVCGCLLPLASLVVICFVSPDFSETLSHNVVLLCVAAHLWYQTIDAIDGKQARRTNNCSPLGQLLDHNLDQISLTCSMLAICAILKVKSNIWAIMSIAPGCFSAHYSIEYRTHFTHFHATQVGMIGATEQLILVELGLLYCWF